MSRGNKLKEVKLAERGWQMTKKIDVDSTKTVTGSRYPPPYDEPCVGRLRRRLGDAAGLTDFGVNLTRLPAGAWSSQRHWHSAEDEFIYVVEGELVLVTDSGEEILRAGDCAGFKAGTANGHHLQNRTGKDAAYLEVGSRRPDDDEVAYPGIDLKAPKGCAGFAHADGRPFAAAK
jgi:uncharacterized cupin superfamily protein